MCFEEELMEKKRHPRTEPWALREMKSKAKETEEWSLRWEDNPESAVL